jgi:hypothetical protein
MEITVVCRININNIDFCLRINLARSIGLSCQEDEQCGNNAKCDRQRCQCNAGVRVVDGQDAYGRTIKLCVNGKIIFEDYLYLIDIRMFFRY